VTTKGDNRVMATCIAAKGKNGRFPKGADNEGEKKDRDKN
jgi:hypothetical protein